MSFNKRNKKISNSVEHTNHLKSQSVPYFTDRKSKKKDLSTVRSQSLKRGHEMSERQNNDKMHEKMIRNMIRETYVESHNQIRKRKSIFALPYKFQRIKIQSQQRSQEILMNRICRECHHHALQSCELPSIAKKEKILKRKKKTLKFKKKTVTQENSYQQYVKDSVNEDDLPDNSKLKGKINKTQDMGSRIYQKQRANKTKGMSPRVHKQQKIHKTEIISPRKHVKQYNFYDSPKKQKSIVTSSVDIVYECDKESEDQAQTDWQNNKSAKNYEISHEQHSSKFDINHSSKFNINNPLTICTIYQTNLCKQFQNRYLPNVGNSPPVNSLLVKFPSYFKVDDFIRKYNPKNQKIKIRQLIRSSLFEIDLNKDQGQEYLYFGEMNYGVRHGLGVYLQRNMIIEGTWVKDQIVQGVLENPQFYYQGQLHQGNRHGHGKCNWKTGAVYVGDWELDQMHGNGFWFDQASNINYLGDWKFSRPQGLGVVKRKGFCSYEGEILNWKPHGKGKQIFQNSDVFEGTFYKGLPDGEGRYSWKKKYKFNGNFTNGSRSAKGKFEAPGILKFEGIYSQDLPNGDGRIVYVNSDQYKGNLKDGLRQGYGTLTCKTKKQIFQGEWENDQLKMKGEE